MQLNLPIIEEEIGSNYNINSESIFIQRDCQRLEGVENRSVDIIITSPPYNLAKEYPGYPPEKDKLSEEEKKIR